VKRDEVIVNFDLFPNSKYDEIYDLNSTKLAHIYSHTTPSNKNNNNNNQQGNHHRTNNSGVIGLENLGNTCYMASTLQCLAHSPFFTDYYLQRTIKKNDVSLLYDNDLNLFNKEGTNGYLTTAFAKVMQKLWSTKNSSLVSSSSFLSFSLSFFLSFFPSFFCLGM